MAGYYLFVATFGSPGYSNSQGKPVHLLVFALWQMAMDLKRSFPAMSMVPVPNKRPRTDDTKAISSYQVQKSAQGQIIPAGMPGSIRRTSSLLSPNMLLTGHESEVYCVKFVPTDGSYVVSAGFDRQILLWETYGECDNVAVMTGWFSCIYGRCWISHAL